MYFTHAPFVALLSGWVGGGGRHPCRKAFAINAKGPRAMPATTEKASLAALVRGRSGSFRSSGVLQPPAAHLEVNQLDPGLSSSGPEVEVRPFSIDEQLGPSGDRQIIQRRLFEDPYAHFGWIDRGKQAVRHDVPQIFTSD